MSLRLASSAPWASSPTTPLTHPGTVVLEHGVDTERIKAIEASLGSPSGWMIAHHRMGSTCNFGPFSSLAAAHAWWEQTGKPMGVSPNFIALFLNVDWNR